MKTTTHEIAPAIFKIRTELPDDGDGFTFNQFLIRADQPLLMHTGPKALFPLVLEALSALIDPADLKWVIVGHFEDDECGALNLWFDAAPQAQCGCLSLLMQAGLAGFANRQPTVLGETQATINLGSHRVRLFATPHFTHAWESQTLYEEVTQTLFTGDFGAQIGMPPPIDAGAAIEVAKKTEALFKSTNVSPLTIQTIRQLQSMPIKTLAIMHGSSINSGVAGALSGLHDYYLGILDQERALLQRNHA
ncbi:MAG: MBL fold metallo-hydrolase [Pseudomonadota bacterium]